MLQCNVYNLLQCNVYNLERKNILIIFYRHVRGCSQILLATKGGGRASTMLTMGDKEGRGVRQMLTLHWLTKGEVGVRQMMTLPETGGKGSGYK